MGSDYEPKPVTRFIGTMVETDRLRLEPFAPTHLDALYAMDSDPVVMRFIGDGVPRTMADTEAAIMRVSARWAEFGFSWWAVVERRSGEVVGGACLQHLANKPGAPLEIGWRLRPQFQGRGFATEAGQAAIDFAFGPVGLGRAVAVANPENSASIRVMERLGMRYLGVQTHYSQPCAVYELQRDWSLGSTKGSDVSPSCS